MERREKWRGWRGERRGEGRGERRGIFISSRDCMCWFQHRLQLNSKPFFFAMDCNESSCAFVPYPGSSLCC